MRAAESSPVTFGERENRASPESCRGAVARGSRAVDRGWCWFNREPKRFNPEPDMAARDQATVGAGRGGVAGVGSTAGRVRGDVSRECGTAGRAWGDVSRGFKPKADRREGCRAGTLRLAAVGGRGGAVEGSERMICTARWDVARGCRSVRATSRNGPSRRKGLERLVAGVRATGCGHPWCPLKRTHAGRYHARSAKVPRVDRELGRRRRIQPPHGRCPRRHAHLAGVATFLEATRRASAGNGRRGVRA